MNAPTSPPGASPYALPATQAAAMRHIISILLENEAGALSRVAGLFSARGYNIESLTVAPTEDATLSRMTIVTVGSDDVIEQITKQLNKLIDVVKVVDLSEAAAHRARADAGQGARDRQGSRGDEAHGRHLPRPHHRRDRDKDYTIELTGTGSKLDAFLKALDRTAILETVRTGASGIGRGERVLRA